MARQVLGGLIQAAAPITDPSAPIDKVRKAAIDVHIPLIEEAGKRGVQILGLQEVFNGPYFCPSQDPHWYEKNVMGSGPFKFSDMQIGQSVSGVRNPDFYRKDQPYLDGFTAIFTPKQAVEMDEIGRAHV